MIDAALIKEKFIGHFEESQAGILAEVITETIRESQRELVKASDFNELKEIVKEIGKKVGELAEAQKRTEQEILRPISSSTRRKKNSYPGNWAK